MQSYGRLCTGYRSLYLSRVEQHSAVAVFSITLEWRYGVKIKGADDNTLSLDF
jgi:hypothetical protein